MSRATGGQTGSAVLIVVTLFAGYLYFTGRLPLVIDAVNGRPVGALPLGGGGGEKPLPADRVPVAQPGTPGASAPSIYNGGVPNGNWWDQNRWPWQQPQPGNVPNRPVRLVTINPGPRAAAGTAPVTIYVPDNQQDCRARVWEQALMMGYDQQGGYDLAVMLCP